MAGIAGAARLTLLLWLVAGSSELAAQQAGRATGQAGRELDRRDGRRLLGDALRAGGGRGFATSQLRGGAAWLPGWPWPAATPQVLCRPVGVVGGVVSPTQSFLAECSGLLLGHHLGPDVTGAHGAFLGHVAGGAFRPDVYGGYAPYPGYGGHGAYFPYGGWAPRPLLLPPEERPHRFYAEFHPDAAGSGVPPLTCDPRPGAACPPSPQPPGTAAISVPPGAGRAAAARALAAGDCAEVTARALTGAVYRGRTSLALLGVERPEDAAVAIESALARGATVALLGEHGYPLYLPPASFLETIEARVCRR